MHKPIKRSWLRKIAGQWFYYFQKMISWYASGILYAHNVDKTVLLYEIFRKVKELNSKESYSECVAQNHAIMMYLPLLSESVVTHSKKT